MAGLRDPDESDKKMDVEADGVFYPDFTNDATSDAAFVSVSRVRLIRPPQLADVNKFFKPLIDAMKRAGVQQVVFLLPQGVESNRLTPHHKIEKLIREAHFPTRFCDRISLCRI